MCMCVCPGAVGGGYVCKERRGGDGVFEDGCACEDVCVCVCV